MTAGTPSSTSTPGTTGFTPTLPSLLAEEVQDSLTEYLTTTYALGDEGARHELARFLQAPDTGVFRGPYYRMRLPFRAAPPGWHNPLGWAPPWFTPHAHQAAAWARLSSFGHEPEPTLVTTGTGSGKTEAFLMPLLDHARRAAAAGLPGITSLVLYPMNALVTDQARRIADLVAREQALSGVRVGLYIGGDGRHPTMDVDHVIDRRSELEAHPPHILLTNYKMLDLLLLDPRHRDLWVGAGESLQYLVLDEFHTYDGAQGSDVAMLLRRLGLALGLAEPERPLGRVTPVATSATLGDAGDTAPMRELAHTVFGCEFPPDCVITESRQSPDEYLPESDPDLAMPEPADLAGLRAPESEDSRSWRALVECVVGESAARRVYGDTEIPDPVVLGDILLAHPMTRLLLEALGERPVSADMALRTMQARTFNLLRWYSEDPDQQARNVRALNRLLALYSFARAAGAWGPKAFLEVQVQLWVRDVAHLLREVTDAPSFAWELSAARDPERTFLPAAYCRACGASGWVSMVQEASDSLEKDAAEIWHTSLRPQKRSRMRVLMTGGETANRRYLDGQSLELHGPGAREDVRERSVAVHAPLMGDDARRETCPACGARDSVRFVGTSAATLLSVCLTREFGSLCLPEGEKKTLVFTDSVQDAAHRAAFIEARAFTFNLRGAVVEKLRSLGGRATLSALANSLGRGEERQGRLRDEDLYAVAPPDFTRRHNWDGEWLARDRGGARHKKLAERLVQETHLEAGLNSRVGRTLLTTGSWSLDLDLDVDALGETLAESHRESAGYLSGSEPGARSYAMWAYEVLAHLREAGGIQHTYLDRYRTMDLNRWQVSGGARGTDMRMFGPGRPAPGFLSTGRGSAASGRETDEIPLSGAPSTWLGDWTRKCLTDTGAGAGRLLGDLVQLCSDEGVLSRVEMRSGGANYGLRPERVLTLLEEPVRLSCSDCDRIEAVAPDRAALWEGAPCPRMRCEGTLTRADAGRPEGEYYRQMYQQGIQRIVAREHSALLDRKEREDLERSFIQHTSPVDPNVLACTPTLELGVDIGDLSTVALASVPRTPANYLQRVGRAGRSDGNAFVLTAAKVTPSVEQRFADPLDLIDGQVRPPAAYLRATELVRRQFLAAVLDHVARTGEVGEPPVRYPDLMRQGLEAGTWARQVIDLVGAHGPELVDTFLAAFPQEARDSRDGLLEYARGGLETDLAELVERWHAEGRVLRHRTDEVGRTVHELQDRGHLDDSGKADLDRCKGELRSLILQRRRHDGTGTSAEPEELFTSLAREGLLPSYNLVDDGTELEAHLWWNVEDPDSTTARTEALDLSYSRPAQTALTELAPGAWFYAGGRRLQVDAVERGTIGDDAPTMRAICPACGCLGDLSDTCPNCGSLAVAEVGQHVVTMPLKSVSSVANLDDTTISDRQDERARTRFLTATVVESRLEDVARAWRSTRMTFGAEMLQRAIIRRYNLGCPATGGRRLTISGVEYVAPGFEVCSGCGVVRDAEQAEDRVRHRGYCPSRHGHSPVFETMYFTHSVTTQAVRILLPELAAVDEAERVAYQAALQLGVREDFGGDPAHLQVFPVNAKDADGVRREYLVLADNVPGGTGYLDRYADPAALRTILGKARKVLQNCACDRQDVDGCHHCVLGAVPDDDLALASRERSLSVLEELLGDWETEDVDTIDAIDVKAQSESVLEADFLKYLEEWTRHQPHGSFQRATGVHGFRNAHLRFEVDGDLHGERTVRSWDVRAQQRAGHGALTTLPDYVLSRPDAPGTARIAVYLDGQRYHADTGDMNRTADDARKRAELRAEGYLVWALTWTDVKSALARLREPAKAPDGTWMAPAMRAKLAEVLPGEANKVARVSGDPLELLTAILADPDSGFWGASAVRVAMVLMLGHRTSDPPPVATAHSMLRRTIDAMVRRTLGLEAGPVALASASTSDVQVAVARGVSGLPVWLSWGPVGVEIDQNLGVLTVLDDREDVSGGESHLRQWSDWLRLSNILQMLELTPDGRRDAARSFGAWTARSLESFGHQDLPLAHIGEETGGVGTAVKVAEAELPATFEAPTEGEATGVAWDSALDMALDLFRPVLEEVRAAGLPAPVIGEEMESGDTLWPIEAQWGIGDALVALNERPDPERDRALADAGYRALDLGMGARRVIAELRTEGGSR